MASLPAKENTSVRSQEMVETPGGSSLSAAARKEQTAMLESRPSELEEMLKGLGLSKYYPVFVEQDVDLQVFLTLNDAELKEVGIK